MAMPAITSETPEVTLAAMVSETPEVALAAMVSETPEATLAAVASEATLEAMTSVPRLQPITGTRAARTTDQAGKPSAAKLLMVHDLVR